MVQTKFVFNKKVFFISVSLLLVVAVASVTAVALVNNNKKTGAVVPTPAPVELRWCVGNPGDCKPSNIPRRPRADDDYVKYPFDLRDSLPALVAKYPSLNLEGTEVLGAPVWFYWSEPEPPSNEILKEILELFYSSSSLKNEFPDLDKRLALFAEEYVDFATEAPIDWRVYPLVNREPINSNVMSKEQYEGRYRFIVSSRTYTPGGCPATDPCANAVVRV